MSEFINTIDVLGDDTVMDSIIDRSITEFKDDKLTTIGSYAFSRCTELERVELPNVVTLSAATEAFSYCSKLKYVEMPSLTTATGTYIFGWSGIEELSLPNLSAHGAKMFIQCNNLKKLNLPKLTKLDGDQIIENTNLIRVVFPAMNGRIYNSSCNSNCVLKYFDANKCTQILRDALKGCASLQAFILRTETVAPLGNVNAFANTPIASGTGYIYVPRALVDSYKTATNWSTYANQFRALEDYTIDGTVNGTFYTIENQLIHVVTSNISDTCKNTYSATLTPESGYTITDVRVLMDGNNITSSAYDGNGNISISSVTGDITIIAAASNGSQHLMITPYDDWLTGYLPYYKLNVTKDQTIEITYKISRAVQGMVLYDGRGCGLSYQANPGVTYRNTTTITPKRDGYIVFNGWHNDNGINGEIFGDRSMYGLYMYISIT